MYDVSLEDCDVLIKENLREFREERSEWLSWLQGEDHNSILNRLEAIERNHRIFFRPIEASHIAILTRGLEGGGVQRVMHHIADELVKRGFRVALLTSRRGKLENAPPSLRVHRFRRMPIMVGRLMALRADPGGIGAMSKPMLPTPFTARQIRLIPDLARHLSDKRPDGLIAATTYMSSAAL